MVSGHHKELEYDQVQEVEGHAAEDQQKIQTFNWSINHPGSVHTMFYSCDWLIQTIIH